MRAGRLINRVVMFDTYECNHCSNEITPQMIHQVAVREESLDNLVLLHPGCNPGASGWFP